MFDRVEKGLYWDRAKKSLDIKPDVWYQYNCQHRVSPFRLTKERRLLSSGVREDPNPGLPGVGLLTVAFLFFGKGGASMPIQRSGKDRVRLSRDNPNVRLVDIRDRINERLASLKIVSAFLTDALENCRETNAEFIGQWSIEFLDASVMAIICFIDDVEKIISE